MIQENNSEKSCKNCGSILKPQQKSYCSRLCQYSGYKIEKVGRIEKICDFCSKIFNVKESRLKRNNVKYCSRLCCDTHKKETYVGEKNPMYGKIPNSKGKKMSAEFCRKNSEARKGKFLLGENNNAKKVIDLQTNIIYDSAKEVSLKFNINYSTLKSYLNNRLPNKTNFKYLNK